MSAGFTAVIFTIGFVIIVSAWIMTSARRKDAAWEELAQSMGAKFIPGGLLKTSKVEAQGRHGVLLLDTYSVPSGDSSTTYTRIRCQAANAQGLQFRITPEGLVARLDKALGLKDLEIGVPEFDQKFLIQGSSETAIKALLDNAALRQLIQEHRPSELRLRGQELRVEVKGVLKDVDRLRALFQLCDMALEQLAA